MEKSKICNCASMVFTSGVVLTMVMIPAYFGFSAYMHEAYNTPIIAISVSSFTTCISLFVVGCIMFCAYMFLSFRGNGDGV